MTRKVNTTAALAIASGVVAAAIPGAALADWFVALGDGWETYVNDRYGTELEYPADQFELAPARADGGGARFASEDATLEVLAWQNINDESAAAMKDRLLNSEGYEDVTYSPSGSNWLVLSGYQGENIFYEKYLLRDGVVHAFAIQFPASEKPKYAPAIERMEDSFRAGEAAYAELTPAPVASSTSATSEAPEPPMSVEEDAAAPTPMRDRLYIEPNP